MIRLPEETSLVPVKDLTAAETRDPDHAHLYAIIEKSADPHARKAAQAHIEQLTARKQKP